VHSSLCGGVSASDAELGADKPVTSQMQTLRLSRCRRLPHLQTADKNTPATSHFIVNWTCNSSISIISTKFLVNSCPRQWWANPKSNPQPQILNLWTSNPKSEKLNPKSQIANTQIKSNLQTLNPKSFPNLPKTYLLPQKIRRTTMQLMSKSCHI